MVVCIAWYYISSYICSMKIENAKIQMRKGVLELCILSIIAEKEAYPSDIIERLCEANMNVVQGTIYPLLMRLKNAGILNYTWKESRSGPPRKYYHLTDTGELFLGELSETWHTLVHAVNESTKNYNKG